MYKRAHQAHAVALPTPGNPPISGDPPDPGRAGRLRARLR